MLARTPSGFSLKCGRSKRLILASIRVGRARPLPTQPTEFQPFPETKRVFPGLSVDLAVGDLARASWTRIGVEPNARVYRLAYPQEWSVVRFPHTSRCTTKSGVGIDSRK